MTRSRRFKRAARGERRGEAVSQPELAAAAAAVEQAREALRKRQQAYEQALEQAAQRGTESRALTLGDIIDSTLEFVRRHPAAGIFAAGFLGFLLGRGRRH